MWKGTNWLNRKQNQPRATASQRERKRAARAQESDQPAAEQCSSLKSTGKTVRLCYREPMRELQAGRERRTESGSPD
jgi:hypothetical protein